MWTTENRTRHDRSKLHDHNDLTDAEWVVPVPRQNSISRPATKPKALPCFLRAPGQSFTSLIQVRSDWWGKQRISPISAMTWLSLVSAIPSGECCPTKKTKRFGYPTPIRAAQKGDAAGTGHTGSRHRHYARQYEAAVAEHLLRAGLGIRLGQK